MCGVCVSVCVWCLCECVGGCVCACLCAVSVCLCLYVYMCVCVDIVYRVYSSVSTSKPKRPTSRAKSSSGTLQLGVPERARDPE